jgi:hypothetical protein
VPLEESPKDRYPLSGSGMMHMMHTQAFGLGDKERAAILCTKSVKMVECPSAPPPLRHAELCPALFPHAEANCVYAMLLSGGQPGLAIQKCYPSSREP